MLLFSGHDHKVLSMTLLSMSTSFNLTGLVREEFIRYYTVVQAFNHAGLHTTEVSDGYMLDDTSPTTGTVRNGYGRCNCTQQH